jgi:adenine/guanine phosphoribosyltransferase-like PRPP-binding protein
MPMAWKLLSNTNEHMPRTTYRVSLTPPAGQPAAGPPFGSEYPIVLSDGSVLTLPIQPLPGGDQAIALLMSNQTPFAVETGLAALLAGVAKTFAPEVITGIPTLGLDYARLVARALGFPHYAPLGNSRKFWYSDELSVPVESVMSAGTKKSLYIDPTLVERVAGKRVLVVDDVINTGGSAAAAIELLGRAGANVVGLAVVLVEGAAWKSVLSGFSPEWPDRVKELGKIPIFQRRADGWYPIP